MQNKGKFYVLKNRVNLPLTCISYFITSGMKDDTVRGEMHLTEHIVIEELMKRKPHLFRENLINAYIDKEFTCFHATGPNNNIPSILDSFGSILECAHTNLSNDIIKRQKEIIFNIENERVMSNSQLVNILGLEQMAFESSLKIPTFVDDTFNSLNANAIQKCIKNQYYSSCHYLIITGDITLSEKDIRQYFKSLLNNMTLVDKTGINECLNDYSMPIDKIKDVDEVRKTVAISLECLNSPDEYYLLHILCMLYKVYINNYLRDNTIYIKDISFKLYTEKVLIFFIYNKEFSETMNILQTIDIENSYDVFQEIKKHFLFGYFSKACNSLDFNKEIFKLMRYFNTQINYHNMISIITNVKFEEIIILHAKLLKGTYLSLSEEHYDRFVKKV